MYLTLDIGTPVRSAYINNKRIQNEFIKNFPTKEVNGHTVFDKLIFYDGTINTATYAKDIYKLIGTSATELGENEYDGVDSAWIYLKPYQISETDMTNYEVSNYINSYSTIGKEITVEVGYTQTVSNVSLRSLPNVTNEQIIAMVEGGYDSVYPTSVTSNETTGNEDSPIEVYNSTMLSYDTDISRVTFAALFDINDDLFTSTSSVTKKSIVPVYSTTGGYYKPAVTSITSYTIQAVVEYKFTRTKDALDASCVPLIDLIRLKANELNYAPHSLFTQIRTMQHFVSPVLDDELNITIKTDTGPDEDGYYEYTIEEYIRVDGATALNPQEFTRMLTKSLATDFQEEKGDWWASLLAIVLIIIVTYFSFGTQTGTAIAVAMAGTGSSALVVFMVTLSMAMTVSMLAISLVSMGMQKTGDYGNAIAMQGSITVLGFITKIIGAVLTVIGIGAIITAIREAATKAAITASIQAAKEKGGEVVISNASTAASQIVTPSLTNWVDATIDYAIAGTSGMFTNASTTETLTAVMDKLNSAFNMYAQYIDPPKEVSEDTVEPYEPDSIDTIKMVQINFESAMCLDLNEGIDGMCYKMTQFKVEEGVSQYYEG